MRKDSPKPEEPAYDLESLPDSLKKFAQGIETNDRNLIKAGISEFIGYFKNLSAKQISLELGISDRAVKYWQTKGTRPSPDVIPKLAALVGKYEAQDDTLAEVFHVREDLAAKKSSALTIGVPPVWDSLIYLGFGDLALMQGVNVSFRLLEGWNDQAIWDLEDGPCDALIHNRFLSSAASKTDPHLAFRMSHPLYRYVGEFVFVRREYAQQRSDAMPASPAKDALKRWLEEPYDLFKKEIQFPKLSGPGPEIIQARRAILEGAKFGYIPGTDIEQAIRKVYDDSFGAGSWMSRRRSDSCQGSRPTFKEVMESFLGTESTQPQFDVFCGGLPVLWKAMLDQKKSFLTLCDPRDLGIASLNGIVVKNERLKIAENREQLDLVAQAFYTGARLFQERKRLDVPVGPNAVPEGKSVMDVPFLLYLANFASLSVPDFGGSILDQSGHPPVRLAWAWARLITKYVRFFETASEANLARTNREVRIYADNVKQLMEDTVP